MTPNTFIEIKYMNLEGVETSVKGTVAEVIAKWREATDDIPANDATVTAVTAERRYNMFEFVQSIYKFCSFELVIAWLSGYRQGYNDFFNRG